MKLTKCEQCGGPTAEGLPLCPDCMRATGAAADQIAAPAALQAMGASGFFAAVRAIERAKESDGENT